MRIPLNSSPLIDLKQIDLPHVAFEFLELPPETKLNRAYHLRGESFLWQRYEPMWEQRGNHSHCLCCTRELSSPPLESLGLTPEQTWWAMGIDDGEWICPECFDCTPFDGRLSTREPHYMAYATYDGDWICCFCFDEVRPVLHLKEQIGDWDDETMSLPAQLEMPFCAV
jgi:hypothetical protein